MHFPLSAGNLYGRKSSGDKLGNTFLEPYGEFRAVLDFRN